MWLIVIDALKLKRIFSNNNYPWLPEPPSAAAIPAKGAIKVRAEKTSTMEGNDGDFHACEECTRNCQLMHGQKSVSSCPISRFFKIMIGGEWPKALFLPPSVSAIVADKEGKETELENAYGEKWTVTLSSYDRRLAFQKGWEEFVLDNDLEGGDLLIFNYMKGSKFVVHIFGKTGREKKCNDILRRNGCQGNASARVKPHKSESVDATKILIQRPKVALKQTSEPPIFGSNSKPSAPGTKSKPFSVPQRASNSPSAFRAQDHGGEDIMSNHVVHESRQAYGNKKIIDGGTSPSNPHSGIRLHAEASNEFIGTEDLESKRNLKATDVSMTEKDHAGTASLAEANKDCIGTKNLKSKVTDISTKNDHTSKRSLLKLIEDRIRAKKIDSNDSNMYTKVTGVSMAEKDQRCLRSLAENKSNNIASEAKVSINAEVKPSVLRDYSTCKYEKETSDDHLFGNFCEEPGQKVLGNEQKSLGAYNGAVFPKSGQKSTGPLKKTVKKEQPESSESGHSDAKRKRDFELAPEGSNVLKTLKIEPCDYTSAVQGTVTCLAVIHGQRLELPDILPALKFMRRGSKAVYLLDEKRRLWPALYEERPGFQVLRCQWDMLNLDHGIQDGDSYVFTVENISQSIYRIHVLRQIQE